jgi:hypothetical protein
VTGFTRPSAASVGAVCAARWSLPSEPERAALARELAAAEPALELFDDVEAPQLLATAWAEAGAPLPSLPPLGAQPAWKAVADRVANWRAEGSETPGCLVVVRQPLRAPDPDGQRDWIAAVLRALDGDDHPPEGLIAATFFASRDGAVVYNFAEWTSPDAHRAALQRGSYGQHGSIGASALWRATREHPVITPEHEVRRYQLHRPATPA